MAEEISYLHKYTLTLMHIVSNKNKLQYTKTHVNVYCLVTTYMLTTDS